MKPSRGTARISKLKTKNLQRKGMGEQAGFIIKPQNSISNRQRLEALPPSSFTLAYGPVTPCVSHQVELHNPGCPIHACQGAAPRPPSQTLTGRDAGSGQSAPA